MRNHAMAWPAVLGPRLPLALAAVLAVAIIPFTYSYSALAEDGLAHAPSAYANDASDDDSDDSDDDAPEPHGSHSGAPAEHQAPPKLDMVDKFGSESASSPAPVQASKPVQSAPLSPQEIVDREQAPRQPAANSPSVTPETNVTPEKNNEPVTVAVHSEGTSDIYDQWSTKKIKSQAKLETSKPHPLALDYPAHFVVVCQAGCRNGMEHIVYLEPQDSRGPVFKTSKENTAAESDFVACVGGCYKSGVNVPLYTVGHTAAHAQTNSWITTSSDDTAAATAPPKSGGRWYERMGDSTAKQP